ncbi:hypothetical protein HDV06_005146 [Boothiomyces sp. JEL0866]|nr:hypothetical protein HDV06_005146 [Boothiomyces sp. JEL0866]
MGADQSKPLPVQKKLASQESSISAKSVDNLFPKSISSASFKSESNIFLKSQPTIRATVNERKLQEKEKSILFSMP